MFTPKRTCYEIYVTRNAHLFDVDGVPGPPCCTVGIKFRSGDEQYGTYTTILDPFPNDEVISNAVALLFEEILMTERALTE